MTKKPKKIDSRPALSKGQKDALFQSALLDTPTYKLVAQSDISIEVFQELDFYLWCIWEVADRFYKRQQRLPALKELRIELEQRMDDPQDYLDDDVVEDITDFYKELKALDEPPLGKDTAREYLQQFFKEKAWRATGHLASAQSKIPVSITEALDTVKADIAAAESLAAEAIPSPFDQKQYDPLTVTSNFIPYGVPFIDAYLGGGGVAGEVYLLLGPSGSAKAQPLTSLILTPDGWVQMGDLVVGDYVIARNGEPTKVLGVFPQGTVPTYEITFSDGTKTQCSGDHLWLVYDKFSSIDERRDPTNPKKRINRTKGKAKIVSAGDLAKQALYRQDIRGWKRWRYWIPMCEPVQFSKQAAPRLDPWLLGFLVGDGNLSDSVGFHCVEPDILLRIQQEIELIGYVLSPQGRGTNDWRIVKETKEKRGANIIRDEIVRYGLNVKSSEKFIPDAYRFGNVETRILFLQGLFDADVTVSSNTDQKGHITFSTSSNQLMKDVRFMIESLGGTATLSHRTNCGYKNKAGTFVRCLDSYLLYIKCSIPLVSSKKHLKKYKPSNVPPHRQIREVKRVEDKACQCILVEDSEHLYLTNNCIVTHNTTLSQQLSISLAALQMAKWEHGNKRQSLGMSYFVSYEMPGHEIMARLYANFAQINVQKFFEGAPLAKGLDMSPQDQVLFAKAIEYGVRVPSEKERYEHAKKRLSNNWRLLDYSGMSLNEDDLPNPGKGSGLWPEIANQIAADMESYKRQGKKRHVAGIFIDYIGIMAQRHCQFHDKDPSRHIRIVCAEAPQNARSYLSYRFSCPVFLVHQLNAAAAKLKPGQIADMGDAAESKTMSHNCNAVFVVSQPTSDEHRLVRINRQKGRRMPGMGSVVLQVQGQYARVREVGDLWSWDDLTREFIPQTSMDVRYRPEKEDAEMKPMRFDGQEFELITFGD